MDFEDAFFDTSDFELTNQRIGGGVFSDVFVANYLNANGGPTQFAAKIIKTEHLRNGRSQMLLIRESEIFHKLHHPAITKFYGINFHSFTDDTIFQPTILTEYFPKGSLQKLLDSRRPNANWTPTKKYICLLGVSHAMKYLHQKGILHRDLKPGNILIDENLYPHICDFGLARCFDQPMSPSISLSMTSDIGTLLYMAPELVIGETNRFSAGIDVFAFSMIAYQVVTGKELYENDQPITINKIIRNLTNGIRPQFPENSVTNQMETLITRCWSNDPRERPSFEEIFNLLSNDFAYSLDNVDSVEIESYLTKLNESNETTNSNTNNNTESSNTNLNTNNNTGSSNTNSNTTNNNESSNTNSNTTNNNDSSNESENNIIRISNLLLDTSNLSQTQISGRFSECKVYKIVIPAENGQPEKVCAKKCFERDYINSSNEQQLFFREIEINGALKHEAILPLIGFSIPNQNSNYYSIITLFMPNDTLETLIKQACRGLAPSNWGTIKSFAIFGIAAGMAYVHQHDIIHQDLKPENIFLDENYHPKISGFSVSNFCKKGSTIKGQFGTIAYMAPEVINDENLTNKIDVYSYGFNR